MWGYYCRINQGWGSRARIFVSGTTVTLTEPLGINHETQLVTIANTSTIGFTPTSVKLGGSPQTFQVGADGSVMVLASLTPYQTLTYTLS